MSGPKLPPLVILPPSAAPPPAPKRGSRARYGLLFPLGIVGLVLLVGWVGWFAYRAWALRDVWQAIAIVHDPAQPMDRRLASARFLANDSRATEDQLEPMVFESRLPMRLRVVLADGLARPADLPNRLPRRMDRYDTIPLAIRLTLLMRMAEAAEPEVRWQATPLERMGVMGGDQSVQALSLYCRAAAFGNAQAASELQAIAETDASENGLASILAAALQSDTNGRVEQLRRAARRLDQTHRAMIAARDPESP